MADDKHDILIRVMADLSAIKGQLASMEKGATDSAGRTARSFDGVTGAVRSVGKEIQGMGGLLKSVFTDFDTMAGKMLIRYQAVKQVLGAIQTGLAPSLGMDTALREVRTLLQVSDEEFAQITADLEAMALRVRRPTEQLVKGFYEVLSSSRELSQDPWKGLQLLEVSAKSAVGGLTETATAAKITTDILAAYGLTADRAGYVSDLLFKTVADGKTRFDELAMHLGPVLPVANSLGISLEEVTGAMAALTLQGFRTPVAATALTSFLRSLATVSEEGKKKAAELGIQWDTTVLKTKGLVGTMELLRNAVGGDAEAMKLLVNDSEGWQAALALTGKGFSTLREEVGAMSDVAGASEAAFERMKDSGANASTVLANAFGTIWREGTDKVLPLLGAFASWVAENVPLIAGGFKSIAAAAFSAASGIVAFKLATVGFGGILAATITGVLTLAAALETLTLWMLANPITAAITAITVAVAGLASVWYLFKDDKGADEQVARFGDNAELAAWQVDNFSDSLRRMRQENKDASQLLPLPEMTPPILTDINAANAAAEMDAQEKRRVAEAKRLADAKAAGVARALIDKEILQDRQKLEFSLVLEHDKALLDAAQRAVDEREDLKKRARERELSADEAASEAFLQAEMAAWKERENQKFEAGERLIDLGRALADSFAATWDGGFANTWKDGLRQILLITLDALHAQMNLAKAWTAAKAVFNWAAALKDLPRLVLAESAFALARGVIQRFETGGPGDFGGFQGLVNRPVLIRAGRMAKMVGEREAEFVAPQKQFRQWANEQLAPLLKGAKGGLTDEDRGLLREIRDALAPARFGRAAGRSIGRELVHAGVGRIGS